MNKPLISVIIPVYNTENNIYRCLDSIVNQTYSNLQVILVDDGSTDTSGAICDEYVRKDKRFVCIHQDNKGVSQARNIGIDMAKGDYLHFPDSDDYIENYTYEYLLNIVSEKDCDIVGFEYFTTYVEYERVHILNNECYGLFGKEMSHKKVIIESPFAWNKLFSRKVIKSVRFNERIFRGEDSLFVQNVIGNMDTMWFDKKPLYHYVQSEDSACRGEFRKNQLTIINLHDEYKKIFEDRYPQIWNLCRAREIGLYISIYYDMYNSKVSLTREMGRLYNLVKFRYKELKQYTDISIKEKMKFYLFCCSPQFFCELHKRIHK